MTTGEHGGYEAAARQYNDCIRAGQIAQAVEWLMEMAEILESEKRYTDALKLGMLTFYFATSGVYAEPVIEDRLAKQICRIVWETHLTLHEREELFLATTRCQSISCQPRTARTSSTSALPAGWRTREKCWADS